MRWGSLSSFLWTLSDPVCSPRPSLLLLPQLHRLTHGRLALPPPQLRRLRPQPDAVAPHSLVVYGAAQPYGARRLAVPRMLTAAARCAPVGARARSDWWASAAWPLVGARAWPRSELARGRWSELAHVDGGRRRGGRTRTRGRWRGARTRTHGRRRGAPMGGRRSGARTRGCRCGARCHRASHAGHDATQHRPTTSRASYDASPGLPLPRRTSRPLLPSSATQHARTPAQQTSTSAQQAS